MTTGMSMMTRGGVAEMRMRVQIPLSLSVASLVLGACAGPTDVHVDDVALDTPAAAQLQGASEQETERPGRGPSRDRLVAAAREAIGSEFSIVGDNAFDSPVGEVVSVTFSRVEEGGEVLVTVSQSVPGDDGWRMLLADIGAVDERDVGDFRVATVERDDLVQVVVLSREGVLTNAYAGRLPYRQGQQLPVPRQRLVEIGRQIAEATR